MMAASYLVRSPLSLLKVAPGMLTVVLARMMLGPVSERNKIGTCCSKRSGMDCSTAVRGKLTRRQQAETGNTTRRVWGGEHG